MSEEQLNVFLEKVKTDSSLQEKLRGVSDAVTVVVIAKEIGFVISADEIKTAQLAPQELSDEELEGAAGGLGGAGFPSLPTYVLLKSDLSNPLIKPLRW